MEGLPDVSPYVLCRRLYLRHGIVLLLSSHEGSPLREATQALLDTEAARCVRDRLSFTNLNLVLHAHAEHSTTRFHFDGARIRVEMPATAAPPCKLDPTEGDDACPYSVTEASSHTLRSALASIGASILTSPCCVAACWSILPW